MASIYPKLIAALVGFLNLAVLNLEAGVVGPTNYAAIFRSTPSAELPLRAAEMILMADERHRSQTTAEVVKAAAGLNPAAVVAVVGSVAEKSPAMAVTAASTAAALEPHMAAAIARAAAAQVPSGAGAIVEAVCRVVPSDYAGIGMAVAWVVPGASREILSGVAAALPGLKSKIDQIAGGYEDKTLLVSTVLVQVSAAEHSEFQSLALVDTIGHLTNGAARPPRQPSLSEAMTGPETSAGSSGGGDFEAGPCNVAEP